MVFRYDDNDPAKGLSAPAPGPVPTAPADEPYNEPASAVKQEHDEPEQEYDEEEEDEVDFNLGGAGPTTNAMVKEEHDDSMDTSHGYGSVHKSASKDDG